jgi:hypothetical protein
MGTGSLIVVGIVVGSFLLTIILSHLIATLGNGISGPEDDND